MTIAPPGEAAIDPTKRLIDAGAQHVIFSGLPVHRPEVIGAFRDRRVPRAGPGVASPHPWGIAVTVVGVGTCAGERDASRPDSFSCHNLAVLHRNNSQKWLFIAALLFVSTGALGLTVREVLTDGPAESPTPTTPGAASTPTPGSSSTPSGPSGRTPSLTILSPADGSTVPAGAVTVEVAVTGFLVTASPRPAGPSGDGHLIYYRDVDFVPTAPGEPAFTTPRTYAQSTDLSHRWTGVSAGRRSFFVQLVHQDNTPLDPPVVRSIVVTAAPLASGSAAPPSRR